MNIAVLCIGSNQAEAECNIMRALRLLYDHGCEELSRTPCYVVNEPYLNCVVKVRSALTYEDLTALSKEIERKMGRRPSMKSKGIVPIDIDVVLLNDVVMRPHDYEAPYFKHGYALLNKNIQG